MAKEQVQNITLSLPTKLIRQLRHRAVDQGTSVSGLVRGVLDNALANDEEYIASKNRLLRLLDEGVDMGTEGKVSWTRSELHER